jgi:purine-binding chemotaxis protein CheW
MPDVVVVEVGGRRLAVPAARVREVAAVSTVTPLPTAPAPVIGLTQLRGQIVPVLDLGVPDENRSPRPQDPLLVLELGPARAALWVDRVLGVQAASESVSFVDVGVLFDQLRAKVVP